MSGASSRKSPKILKARVRFGNKIKELIRASYPSIENFALSHGLNKAMIQSIIQGKSDPQLSTLMRLADALDVSLVRLVEDVYP